MTTDPPVPINLAPLPNDLQASYRELSIRAWNLVLSVDKAFDLDRRADLTFWGQVRDDATSLRSLLDLLRSPQ